MRIVSDFGDKMKYLDSVDSDNKDICPGDIVVPTEGPWALTFKDGKFTHEYVSCPLNHSVYSLNYGFVEKWVVVATGGQFPTYQMEKHDIINDVMMVSLKYKNEITFIYSKFLRKVGQA